MKRRFSILLLLTIFVLSLASASAFAAKVKTAAQNAASAAVSNEIVANSTTFSREARVGGSDDPTEQYVGTGKPSSSVMQSLGFQSAAGTVNLGATTRYDLPSNQSQPRQIVLGCSGNIYACWMNLQPAATRLIAGAAYIPGGAIGVNDISGSGGGFPSLTVDGNGLGIGAWHRVAGGGTMVGQDFACAGMTFSEILYPDTTAVKTGLSETGVNYLWPQIATDKDGSGNWFVHVVAHESPLTTDTSGYQSLVYWRSQNNSKNPQGTIATFIDSVSAIGATVVSHPDQADQRVAIIYPKPRYYSPIIYSNDNIVYRQSTNLGATWGPVQTVYNYAATQEMIQSTSPQFERGWETSGLYAADGCLHVLFQSTWSDTGATFTGDGGFILIYPAKIYHWDNCSNCASLVTERRTAAATCNLGGVALRDVSKVNIAECAGKLYAIFSKSLSTEGDDVLPDFRDCSTAGFANFEIFVKASSTAGLTWGPDSNVTKTTTNNCAAGSCSSELHLGSMEHSTDSLRILYMEDKDAGINVNTNGAATDNPIKVLSLGCFNMATFTNLASAPTSIGYPLNVPPGNIKDTTIVVSNLGNTPTNFTLSSTVAWITFPGGTSLLAPAGCTNTISFVARINTTGFPGGGSFASGTINITYTSPDKAGQAVTAIPVDLYSFPSFFLPVDQAIRTSCNRIMVNQASEIADNVDGRRFSYFADASDYLYDGFLILGNSAANLTYSTYGGAGSVGLPTVSNPYGFLYAATATTAYDSTSNATYRFASGQGYNRDSTIQFRANYYAPKSPALCNFYVLVFTLKKGPKNPSGTISNLTVGYYADWDIPADTGSDNRAAADASRHMLYQVGSDFTAPNDNETRFGALGGLRDDGSDSNVVGGMVVQNPTYIYPEVGWENDSLWNRMEGISYNEFEISANAYPSGPVEDLSMALVLAKKRVINGATNDSLKYAVVVAGTPSGGSVANLQTVMDDAYNFICTNNLITCSVCACGDADNNGIITISDAVFLINYIFAGGPAPAQLCLGDADGNAIITISDAVFLINYIFAGGPAPSGC